MEFDKSLLTGVVGGLIATVIVVTFREFWSNVIVPWIEERLYQDAHIEGPWRSRYEVDGVAREGVMNIHRKGHSVRIEVTRIRGPKTGHSWHFKGTFKNLTLTATYTPSNRRMLDRGSVTLMLLDNGETLRGWLAFYSNADNCVRAAEYECRRVHEDNISGQTAGTTELVSVEPKRA